MPEPVTIETANPMDDGWREGEDFNVRPDEIATITLGEFARRVSPDTLPDFLKRIEQSTHAETRGLLLNTAKESLVLQGHTDDEAKTALQFDKWNSPVMMADNAGTYIDALRGAIITGNDFLSMNIPSRPLIVAPWLKFGDIALITAPRGIGKTNFILSLLIAITHNQGFAPWRVETPVPCALIDGEMPLAELQGRYARLLKGLPDPVHPLKIISAEMMHHRGFPAPNLTRAEHREAILTTLKESDIKLVVFDNLSALSPGIDENSKEQYDPINQFFLSIRFLGISVIIVHHSGKDYKKVAQRGTSGREDSVDYSIFLSRPKDYRPEEGCRLTVEFTKTRGISGMDAATFGFRLIDSDNNGLAWMTETTKVNNATGAVKGKVIWMLGQGYSQKEIGDELKKDKAYISRIKDKAVEDGLIELDTEAGRGKYIFTGKGEDLYGQKEAPDDCEL